MQNRRSFYWVLLVLGKGKGTKICIAPHRTSPLKRSGMDCTVFIL